MKTRKHLMGLAIAAGAGAMLFGTSAQADVIARYTFDNSSVASSDTAGGSTAGDVIEGPHGDVMKITTDAGEGNPLPAYHFDARISGNSADDNKQDSIDAGDYITFTVTADSGVLPNLASLAIDQAAEAVTNEGGSYTGHVFVRSSVDGFSGDIGTDTTTSADHGEVGPFQTFTFNLDSSFNGLTEVTFRIYAWDGSSSSNKGLIVDNITLNTVPEPASGALALLGLGALVMLPRRNRKVAG